MPRVRLPTADTLPLRWSPDDASAVLAAFRSSGFSPEEFCRRTGIQWQRLRRWQDRLAAPSEEMRLVEVVARVAPTEALEVVSPSGWRLRVPPAMLADVLRALSEGGC